MSSHNDTIVIPLTQEQETIIDSIDADIAAFKWQAQYNPNTDSYYATRNSHHKTERMHCVILARKLDRPLAKGELCDHINGYTLDNRRSNLRPATHSQNMHNSKKPKHNTSGYKGVSLHKPANKWRADIQVNGTKMFLGLFNTAEQAYNVYCEAALKHHGKFARLK